MMYKFMYDRRHDQTPVTWSTTRKSHGCPESNTCTTR